MNQLVIVLLVLHQGIVVADLDNHAVAEHDDLVRLADGAESVGDDDGGAVGKGSIEGLHDFLFVDGVERVGGFVEEEVIRAFVEGAGDEDALALPAAQTAPQFADGRLVALGHLLDFAGDVGDFGGLPEGFVVHLFFVQDDVVEDGVVEELAFLHDAAAAFAPLAEADRADVHAADGDFAEAGLVQAEQ